jgi:restriction system protein
MLLLFAAAFLLLFGSGAYKYWLKDRELEALRSRSLQVWETNRQVHRTLATGLYYRFHQESGDRTKDAQDISPVYIRNNPYELAYFVSDILEGTLGGQAYVTQASAGAGVDIEHERKEGLFLIQVRCSRTDTDLEAIALLHSQVVRQKAQGGWVISTGGFTDAARRYADETDIVWVDGIRLAKLWGEYLERLEQKGHQEEEIKGSFHPAMT